MTLKWEAFRFADTQECVVLEVNDAGKTVRWIAHRIPTPGLARRIAKLLELEAAINKLPNGQKTKDGVPVGPGEQVYFTDGPTVAIPLRVAGYADWEHDIDGQWHAHADGRYADGRYALYRVDLCWSTLEAAGKEETHNVR